MSNNPEKIVVKNCTSCPVQSDWYCNLLKEYIFWCIEDRDVDDNCPLLSGSVLLVLAEKNGESNGN